MGRDEDRRVQRATIPDAVIELLRDLDARGGEAWYSTAQTKTLRPDAHPSTVRAARQRRLISESARRGLPKPAVQLKLTARGYQALEAAAG